MAIRLSLFFLFASRAKKEKKVEMEILHQCKQELYELQMGENLLMSQPIKANSDKEN